MPERNGIDWEGLTGKAMEDITQSDINTVIVAKLISIEKCTANVRVMEAFYKVLIILSPIFATAIISLLVAFINHLAS